MITVLLISYNHEKFIEKAIKSVLEQKTNFDFKIKIFDDASTDNCSKIINDFKEIYGRKIDVKIREKNLGYIENIYLAIKK